MNEEVNTPGSGSVGEDHAGTGMDDVFRLLSNSPHSRGSKIVLTKEQRRRRVHQAGRASAAVMAVRFCSPATGT